MSNETYDETSVLVVKKDIKIGYIAKKENINKDDFFCFDVDGADISGVEESFKCIFTKIERLVEKLEEWLYLLPRSSKTQPGMVAYFENDEKRKRGVLSLIKPGRFLRKYVSDLTDSEIENFANKWLSESIDLLNLVFLTDANDIKGAYTKSKIKSCMSYDFYEDLHPSAIYSSTEDFKNDLALAVLYNSNDKLPENIIARTVVWPDKKIHSCVYGDYQKMKNILNSLNFERGDLENAKIRKIKSSYEDVYIGAYIDGAYYCEVDEDHLLISNCHGINCQRTDGYITDANRCSECEEFSEDCEYYDDLEACLCHSCFNDNYFVSDYSNHVFNIDYLSDVEVIGSQYDRISKCEFDELLSSGEIIECEYQNKFYTYDYSFIETETHGYVEESEFEKAGGYKCVQSDLYFIDENYTRLDNGDKVNNIYIEVWEEENKEIIDKLESV